MGINEKSRNLYQPSRLTRDLGDKLRAFGLAQRFQSLKQPLGQEERQRDHTARRLPAPADCRSSLSPRRDLSNCLKTGREHEPKLL
jgi:hypothetical protein